jgi:hypothetical protein
MRGHSAGKDTAARSFFRCRFLALWEVALTFFPSGALWLAVRAVACRFSYTLFIIYYRYAFFFVLRTTCIKST